MRRRVLLLWGVTVTGFSLAASVHLHCLIVGFPRDEELVLPRTEAEVREMVADVNRIYAQAAISCEISSIGANNHRDFAEVDANDGAQLGSLCSIMRDTGGLEVYFVHSMENGDGVYTPEGIVISREANFRTVAHEIGHALGWPDIYVERDSTFRTVKGAPSASRLPLDNGFFPSGTMQPDLVRRLLMYGIASETKGRIPRGDVYGLQVLPAEVPGGARVLRFGLVPVGMFGVTNRSPRSL